MGDERADRGDALRVPAASVAQGSAALTRFTTWIVLVYVGFVLFAMLAAGDEPDPDVLLLLAGIGVLLVARGIPFVRDWGPLLIVLLGWEAQRGITTEIGQLVPPDLVVGVERTLAGGIIPAVALQEALRLPGIITPLDIGMSLVYLAHFVYPVAFALWLWRVDRARYYRFAMTLLGVSFAAFFTFILLPVAPPRFTELAGSPLPVTDVMAEVSRSFGWNAPASAYVRLLGNPYAAFPSMHAAYPVIVLLFLRERSRWLAMAWAPIVVLIWFATVYLGHHFVIDLIVGTGYALAGYYLVRLPWSGIAERLQGRDGGRIPAGG
jgi:membrane-associated phospholipid phosphatase